MKVIKYIQLFNFLIKEEELDLLNASRTIRKIRQLPDALKLAVWNVLEGKVPFVEYYEVTLQELIDNEQMKPIRAILMLDWLRREPAIAMRYMETERYKAPQKVTDSDKEMLQQVLKKLQNSKSSDEEDSKEDIVIGDDK